jgi:amidase
MAKLSRRQTLLGGAAVSLLAGCGSTEAPAIEADAPPENTDASKPTTTNTAPFRDGLAIAAMIASGETTAEAEAEAAISRAESVNGQINAIATKTYEDARQRATTDLTGPFAGVPSFIKDLQDWTGAPTMFGSRAFVGNTAKSDGALANSWRNAGVVVLGKSTTPEMGLTSTTEPLVTGDTRNPWDITRMTGGSSGGAAALVAARVVPFAHASDGGGSIRIPASTCGLFGLKPSASRLYSRKGPKPPVDISISNCVTLTVRDSEALFRVAEKATDYPALEAASPLNRKLRIGFSPASATGTVVAPETIKALENTAQLCRDLGHEVFDYTPDIDGKAFEDAFLMYWSAGAAAFAQSASDFSGKPIGPDILEPWTLSLAQKFESRKSEMPTLIGNLIAFQAQYDSWFESMDVFLTPVTGSPAVPIGEQSITGPFEEILEKVTTFAAFTAPMNVSGAPSMSVPLGQSDGGLPIGSMFSGRKGDDALLYALAYQLEEAQPWIDRLPPLHT